MNVSSIGLIVFLFLFITFASLYRDERKKNKLAREACEKADERLKHFIQDCKLLLTQKGVDQELIRLAQRFQLAKQDKLSVEEKERLGCSPETYRNLFENARRAAQVIGFEVKESVEAYLTEN